MPPASSTRMSSIRSTSGLATVSEEVEDGSFPFEADDEDVHMAIERRLTELVGPLGGKLHTGRSRNDQVATDVALYVRDHAGLAGRLAVRLMARLHELAERHADWPMPGYTHLQRAQPVYLDTTFSPTSGCSSATRAGSPRRGARRGAPARLGGARRAELGSRPGCRRAAIWASTR